MFDGIQLNDDFVVKLIEQGLLIIRGVGNGLSGRKGISDQDHGYEKYRNQGSGNAKEQVKNPSFSEHAASPPLACSQSKSAIFYNMINQNEPMNQLPREIRPAFYELNVHQHLRAAGFKKKYGLDYFSLFQLVFALLFHQKNWFRLLESDKAESFPGKDAVYRFLNQMTYNRRRFLTALSSFVVNQMSPLTSLKRVKVFIFDDSMFDRNRSKKVELLARFKDHATGAFYKGFRMLTMGWSDGHSFVPLDLSLIAQTRMNGWPFYPRSYAQRRRSH